MIELDVRGVYKNFGGLQALNGVNFSIRGNELIGLIGPNGAGKTTLTNVLDGVYKPSNGEVRLNGRRIDGLPPYEIARFPAHDGDGEHARPGHGAPSDGPPA
jgi:branched-chain amino acid transport system ATP-binding protein